MPAFQGLRFWSDAGCISLGFARRFATLVEEEKMRRAFVVVVDAPPPDPILRPGYNPDKCNALVEQSMAELYIDGLRLTACDVPHGWGNCRRLLPGEIGA
jgi:hypothetical protein